MEFAYYFEFCRKRLLCVAPRGLTTLGLPITPHAQRREVTPRSRMGSVASRRLVGRLNGSDRLSIRVDHEDRAVWKIAGEC